MKKYRKTLFFEGREKTLFFKVFILVVTWRELLLGSLEGYHSSDTLSKLVKEDGIFIKIHQ